MFEKLKHLNQMSVLSKDIIEKYRKKILLVLDYLRVQYREVLFISIYKKNEISPELSL